MTISTQSAQVILLGNGATTIFNFPFVGAAAADIQVTYINANNNSTVLSPSQYTLVLNAAAPGQLWGVGGTVTYPTAGPAIANGTFLVITRIVPLTQSVTISNQGSFAPQVIEQAMDLLEMQIQQVAARTGLFRGTWATGIVYYGGDVVVDGVNGTNTGNFYMCAIQNTSGVWATDLANGKWVLAYIGLTAANIAAVLGYTPMNGANNLSEITNAVTARTNLGLGSIATQNSNNVTITGGSITGVTITGHASLDLAIANNLSDLANSSTARTNLGLGSIATQNSNSVTITGGTINNLTMTNSVLRNTTIGDVNPTTGVFTTLACTSLTVNGSGVQPLDATLTALAAYNTNGLLTQTAADTFVGRSVAGTTNQVTITNGDGVAGNPTISLPNSVQFGTSNTISNTDNAIIGGNSNTNSRSQSVIAGGNSNTISSGSGHFIAAGGSNVISAGNASCAIIGGANNSITGAFAQQCLILGGANNLISASTTAAIAMGIYAKPTNQAQISHSTGRFAAVGDAQTSQLNIRAQTTNATPTEIGTDGFGERMVIPTDTAWLFNVYLIARRTDANNECAAYQITGAIDNNAGTVAFVGTPTTTIIAEDTVAWDATVTADNVNKALVIKGIGEAAKTIYWVGFVRLVEVTG